jgi:hypothetical protein
MEYYLLLGFLLFIALFAHMAIAVMVHHTLCDNEDIGWYKSKYKRYLLIPGVAEVALVLLFLIALVIFTYGYFMYFFED